MGPVVAKKQFSVAYPSASRPSFEAAFLKKNETSGARRGGRDRRNAPVFQVVTINSLIVYMYGFLAFVFSSSLNSNAVAVFCT